MRILVTGSSGHLGRVLTRQLALLEQVELVTAIDLKEPGEPLPSKVQFARMDTRSPDLPRLMAGHNVVIHTAFTLLWPARMPAAFRDDINFTGLRNVACSAVACHVDKFIHASSTAAYDPKLLAGQTDVTEDFPIGKGDGLFYYANSKAMAERILQEILEPAHVRLTLLRPVSFVGPTSAQALTILRDTAASIPGLDPRIQFLQEDDVGAAFVQAVCTDMPGAYNVTPDDYIRSHEIWNAIGKKWVPTIPRPLMGRIVYFRWRYLGAMTHPHWLVARLADFTASNKKLRATGWKPRYGSAEALRTAVRKVS